MRILLIRDKKKSLNTFIIILYIKELRFLKIANIIFYNRFSYRKKDNEIF